MKLNDVLALQLGQKIGYRETPGGPVLTATVLQTEPRHDRGDHLFVVRLDDSAAKITLELESILLEGEQDMSKIPDIPQIYPPPPPPPPRPTSLGPPLST